MGIDQVCSIFISNPKKGFSPKEIKDRIERSLEGKKLPSSNVRSWIKRLKDRGIIEKSGNNYHLKSVKLAMDFLDKRYVTPKKQRASPDPSQEIQLTDNHLLKLEGNVLFPKTTIDLWLNMNLLEYPHPNDPAQQVSWECQSFKVVVSLKTYKGSMYIKSMDYKDEAKELFGEAFLNQIENLQISKHLGLTADSLTGIRYKRGDFSVEVDSGSRTGVSEVEYKGKEMQVTNALEYLIREGVDITIIEEQIFKVLENLEKRHTREISGIGRILDRTIESMDYQAQLTQTKLTEFKEEIGGELKQINKELKAIHETILKPQIHFVEPPFDEKKMSHNFQSDRSTGENQ